MAAPQLRDYQTEGVAAIRAAFREGKRAPLFTLSTGGGKTTVFGYVTTSAASKGRCVYLIAHRAELVKQIAITLARYGTRHQIIAPGPIVRQSQVEQFKEFGKSLVDPQSRVFVCSVQTLVKRMDKLPAPDLIVIDEAHHLTTNSSWGRVVAAYPDAHLLPVTATPIRLDGKGLGVGQGGFADCLIIGPTMGQLIEQGYLSPYRVFAPPNLLDLAAVKTRAGDFAKDALADAMDKPTITGDAVQHYLRLARGKRAVAFCVSVAHAEHVAAEFSAAGVAAESLDGTMDAAERDARIKRFGAGETLVLTSADLISEGFDIPAIEVAILLRPTKSLALYLQQVGRSLRIFPGKTEALILDHVGAVITHGLPDEDRDWTLDGVKRKPRAANDNDEPDVGLCTCPQCFTIHIPAPRCPNPDLNGTGEPCGYEYPPQDRAAPKQEDGELVEIDPATMDALRRQKRVMQGKAQTKAELVAQGISPFRADKIIQAREAKAELIDNIMEGIDAVREATGQGPYAAFAVTLGDIRKMPPKGLKELLARINARVVEIQQSA